MFKYIYTQTHARTLLALTQSRPARRLLRQHTFKHTPGKRRSRACVRPTAYTSTCTQTGLNIMEQTCERPSTKALTRGRSSAGFDTCSGPCVPCQGLYRNTALFSLLMKYLQARPTRNHNISSRYPPQSRKLASQISICKQAQSRFSCGEIRTVTSVRHACGRAHTEHVTGNCLTLAVHNLVRMGYVHAHGTSLALLFTELARRPVLRNMTRPCWMRQHVHRPDAAKARRAHGSTSS